MILITTIFIITIIIIIIIVLAFYFIFNPISFNHHLIKIIHIKLATIIKFLNCFIKGLIIGKNLLMSSI